MKPVLILLVSLTLSGCAVTSDKMLQVMQDPTAGALANWIEYRPLKVQHIDRITP